MAHNQQSNQEMIIHARNSEDSRPKAILRTRVTFFGYRNTGKTQTVWTMLRNGYFPKTINSNQYRVQQFTIVDAVFTLGNGTKSYFLKKLQESDLYAAFLSCTSKQSLEYANYWLNFLREELKIQPYRIIIVRTKYDIQGQKISRSNTIELLKLMGSKCMKCLLQIKVKLELMQEWRSKQLEWQQQKINLIGSKGSGKTTIEQSLKSQLFTYDEITFPINLQWNKLTVDVSKNHIIIVDEKDESKKQALAFLEILQFQEFKKKIVIILNNKADIEWRQITQIFNKYDIPVLEYPICKESLRRIILKHFSNKKKIEPPRPKVEPPSSTCLIF